MSQAHSQANFNPAQLTVDVANLCKQVADIQAIITGKSDFKISEIVEGLDAIGRVVGDFVPRVQQLEMLIGPLLPLIPVLEKQFAGESAGIGASASEGVVIPSEEIGRYSDPAPVVLESRDPPPADTVQDHNPDPIPATA